MNITAIALLAALGAAPAAAVPAHMADKALSVDAHNVKIVTVNGHVTLNGVVRSEAEKSAVIAKAVTVAGSDNVLDALRVAPKS